MIGPIVQVTLRQLLGKRRMLVLAAFGLLPLLLALVFRFAGEDDPARWIARPLYSGIVLTILLPLAALVFGTAVIGSEIEDGTAVYLLGRPIPRWRILLSKATVAWVIATLFVVISALPAAAIASQGADDTLAVTFAFTVAAIAGSLVYTSLFVLLSIMTSRAFVVGLVYVLIWEGLVTRLFRGVRIFSIRQYTMGLADGLANVSKDILDAPLNPVTAVILMALAVALTFTIAVRRLQRFELGEST